ncbi:MAG TPA: helix-turn-helix domain-containing protein [Longimicrobium sp.]|nr:helix-turn-helix domain-containing protein [Longimicrobium sp.]
MQVRTIWEVGLLIRDRRLELGWSQAQLADRLGVTRQWVMSLEQGNAGAALGQVLQAMLVLGLVVDVRECRTRKGSGRPRRNVTYDDVSSYLDEVVKRARDAGALDPLDGDAGGSGTSEGEVPPRTPLRRQGED